MLKIEDILREDFDWENVEIDEDEFDELENQLIINYLKKNSPKERQLLAMAFFPFDFANMLTTLCHNNLPHLPGEHRYPFHKPR